MSLTSTVAGDIERAGGRAVIVHKVMSGGGAHSWTVLGGDGLPFGPAEAYLAHLTALERSPNTLRAYAHSLQMWLEFLDRQQSGWREAGVEQVSRFVAWLRAPAANVIVLDAGEAARTPATVNRHLAAVFGFYDFHARAGVGLAADLIAWRRTGRGSYKPFLHHVTAGKPVPVRPVKLAVPQRIPATLTDGQIRALLEACTHLRDQFLLALLAESGARIGQVLGLRHCDVVSRDKVICIVPRDDNANGARAKTRRVHQVPVSASLIRLYSEYMHVEYGALDSDYVFVNLFAEPLGAPLRYQAVQALVSGLRKRTGIEFTCHTLRHSHATDLIRRGVPVEVVSKRLTHASVTTTSAAYVHLQADDMRAELVRAGVWPGPGGQA
ncbi:MAG: tyrosine-type recombinase/integrase [Streptosporangiaceae bacterium]